MLAKSNTNDIESNKQHKYLKENETSPNFSTLLIREVNLMKLQHKIHHKLE